MKGEYLALLDLRLENFAREMDDTSLTVEELQRILNVYALAFLIGHECGHIVLGHIDRKLAHVQMLGETALSNTHLEEAHADMIGAFAIISMKKEIDRMTILTTEVTAVGLLQLPVLCVISELQRR